MPRVFEGDLNAAGLRFAVVASRFHDEIVSGLLRGAIECLHRHDAEDERITVYRVPGAFEIPTVVSLLAGRGGMDAIIALGCLVRGDTPHFEYISAQVTDGLSRVSTESRHPVAFGVITCDTYEQAKVRSSDGAGNKGWEAALAAIEMANLWRALRTT
ncbi:MAG TPA: 6,7-dimethyl-8-ribityllumazine synthase [Thermoanaerobaculia bacterium]|nr:6,7-dimethyl-8-ribityllumazine synthase [Thermoanaerobaculia bacterium]